MEPPEPLVHVELVTGARPQAHARLSEALGAVAIGRLCPRCGSSGHGRPWVRVASGTAPSVSISYAGGLAVIAWTRDGVVGVDAELAGTDAGVYGDLATWTRAESILKATGEGLLRDPADLPDLPGLWSRPLDLRVDLVAHVAVLQVSAGGVGGRGARAS